MLIKKIECITQYNVYLSFFKVHETVFIEIDETQIFHAFVVSFNYWCGSSFLVFALPPCKKQGSPKLKTLPSNYLRKVLSNSLNKFISYEGYIIFYILTACHA